MALFYLILCLCLFQIVPSISALTYKCKGPNKDLVNQLENQYGFDISNVDQVLTYEYKDFLVDPPFNGYTSLVFDNIKVKFAGYLLLKGKNAGVITKENFDTKTVDFRHQVVNQKNQCKVIKAGFIKTKETNPKQAAIHKLTIGCLEEFVGEQWDEFIAHDSRVKEEFETTINQIFKKNTTANKADGHYDIQSTWNSLFDIGKTIAINELLYGKHGRGLLYLPNLEQNFTKLFINGHILMTLINVDGLKSLERTKDITVNRHKNRYEFSTGIQFTNLKVKILQYMVQWGSSLIDGYVGVTFPKLGLSIKLHVDYNSSPCEVGVDELTQDILEDPKVDFTGLGVPFDWAVRKIAEYYLKNNLVNELRKAIVWKIGELNCSKYRSAVESVKF